MVSEHASFVLVAVVAAVALATVFVGIGYVFWLCGRLFALPGVVVHELAHKTACDLAGVHVAEVVYFRLGDPAGYVVHERPTRYSASFAIGVAPFLANTVVSFAAFLALGVLVSRIGDPRAVAAETVAAGVALGWLGLSVGMAAFPSTGDASELWNRSRSEWRRSPSVLLGVPVVALIYVANLLSRLWAHVLYALALGAFAFAAVGLGPF
ncbi:metalloprotease family protein [Natrarchaeobius oligotrophus]|uniref:DUF3267 domain-containing protein n=1 Tax=Natrarchaeobius chitinivorans TaxID=1679083 RepID=A0A3N6M282_NATCH|nr:metalloprotease family protein [Natrarchaeobius chitinivorans]RQG97488.1 DUF3267 domain-containing protein [Natrarchaeobius chitinivorans]